MTTTAPRVDIESIVRLTELADYIVPFTIRVMCDLEIADRLADGPRHIDDLAAESGADADALGRGLRALAGKDIFTEIEPDTFALTPLAEPLRSDHPLSLREAYPLLSADVKAWSAFDHSIKTGEAAFDEVHGIGYWQYMADNADESYRFNRSQRAATNLEVRTILPVYPWQDVSTLVDIGGGNGSFLSGILRRNKHLTGTLFDLPHVVENSKEVFADDAVTDRTTYEGGSFFEGGIPEGADLYTMKRILYHWNDEKATTLLTNVRKAMRDDSKLLIIEPVMRPGNEFDVGKEYDLLLLALAGGRARSEDEIAKLLANNGFRYERLIPTMLLPIVEATPI